MHPPHLPQALLLYSVAMVRSNPSLCSSALTTHPLTQQRMRGVHDLLHLAGMLLPGAIFLSACACFLKGGCWLCFLPAWCCRARGWGRDSSAWLGGDRAPHG